MKKIDHKYEGNNLELFWMASETTVLQLLQVTSNTERC